jgi:peptidoglycan/LPS O-acetylase OafA/YrhL
MKSLDLVRALSGLVVFFSHFCQIFLLPFFGKTPTIEFFLESSRYAVMAFFVLSGYLIAMSAEKNIKTSNGADFDASKYAIKRFVRIYPPLLFSVLLVFLIWLLIHSFDLNGAKSFYIPGDRFELPRSSFEFSFRSAISTLLQIYAFAPGDYLSANGPLWSLSYEVGFYIYFALLLKSFFVFRKRNFKKLSLLIPATALLLWSPVHFNRGLFFYYFSIWLLGLFSHPSNRHKAILILFASSFALTGALTRGRIVWYEVIFSLLICQFIQFKNLIEIHLPKIILNFSSELAKSTYTLYICHFPMMLLVFSIAHPLFYQNTTLYWVVALCGSLGILLFTNWVSKYLEATWRFEYLFFSPKR